MKSKVTTNLEIERAQQDWLEAMATKYELPDPSKALRVVLDHARMSDDEKAIFTSIRCLGCQ
jgi:hypothetical protein